MQEDLEIWFANLWSLLAGLGEEVSKWSGDRWIAVIAAVVAALAGVGTFWQAAEARGAKKLALQALTESKRSADAAQDSAVQAQRVADIEAGRDHDDSRRAISIKRFEVRKGQRFAVLSNNGQRAVRVAPAVIQVAGTHSPPGSFEILPGGSMEVLLGAKDGHYSILELAIDGDCPCSNAEASQSHWLIKLDIPKLQ